ncbi:hypothetical protein ABZ761_24420 [Kitasatospora sp. NPDC006786]
MAAARAHGRPGEPEDYAVLNRASPGRAARRRPPGRRAHGSWGSSSQRAR